MIDYEKESMKHQEDSQVLHTVMALLAAEA